MPSETGYWNANEAATQHDFSYQLARWIADFLPKDKPVVDFGAGNGEYVRYLHDVGFNHVIAVEGNKETVTQIGNVIEIDLAKTFTVQHNYNSISLEVGEHLPEEYLQNFLDNLSNNTKDKLILSWAIPGQDGYHHVSCKHNIWVIGELQKRGFKFLPDESLNARSVVENRLSYFRNTLMVFEKC